MECPYEKGFFVNASKFEKHLKNCPKLVNKQREEKNEWFSKDINKMDENIQEAHIDEVQNLHEVPDEQIDRIIKTLIDLYLRIFEEKDQLFFIESSPK